MRRSFVRFASAFALLGALVSPVAASKSPTEIATEIDTSLADNKQGLITEALLRTVLKDIAAAQTSLYYLVTTCATNQWVSGFATTGAPNCTRPAFSNISGSIQPGQMIAPGVGTLGGVYSSSAGSNQFATGIDVTGTVTYAQPSFSNLSGTIAAAQLIAPGASTFGAVKSSSAPTNQFATGINTSGVVTYAQPAFSNLSGTISAAQLIAPGASTFGAVKSSSAPANQFATGIDTSGAVTYAQPSAANVSGLFPYAVGTAGTGLNATATAFSSANQALWLAGTYTGNGYAPYVQISATDTGSNTAIIASGGANPLSALSVAHNINNGAGEGNRYGINAVMTKSAATSGTNAAKKFFTPLFSRMYVQSGDGGSGGGPTYYGAHYGLASLIEVNASGQYLDAVIGAEIDVAMQTSSSSSLKTILLLSSVNSDAVKGTTHDAMLSFGADSTATAKWTYGAAFGWPRGPWPFDTSSTLIGTVAPGSGSRVANYGIDFSAVTFSTAFLKSSGFQVGPSGATTVSTLTATSTISTTGAAAGFVAGPRGGSGNSYQWYNPSGTGLKLTDGGSDLISLTSTGAIYAGGEIAPVNTVVGSLGTCNSTTRGALKVVTDGAAALAWGATQTGGASSVYLSFCNGAAWTVAAK